MRAGTVVFYFLMLVLLVVLSVQYGLGRLPGDIVVDTGSFYFYLPFTTAIIVAVLLGVVFWIFGRR